MSFGHIVKEHIISTVHVNSSMCFTFCLVFLEAFHLYTSFRERGREKMEEGERDGGVRGEGGERERWRNGKRGKRWG